MSRRSDYRAAWYFAPDGSVIVVDRGNIRVMRFSLPNVAPPTTTDSVLPQ